MWALGRKRPQETVNCDFELKNRSGFCLQGFIAGARFEPTTLLSKSLDNEDAEEEERRIAKVETVILS